jgi:HD-like signal output (HDOD) protein/CheY-like chemotaxis protein
MHRILIVDDMAIVREPLSAALGHAGFETAVSEGGAGAIPLMVKKAPDLVVLDIQMPNVDGLTILRQMRSDPTLRGIPVIVLSSGADRETVAAAARLGISGYVLKDSFSMQELIKRIREALAPPATSAKGRAKDTPVKAPPVAPAPGGARAARSPSTAADHGASKPPAAARVPASSAGPTPAAVTPAMTREQLFALVDRCGELQGLSPTMSYVVQLTANSSVTADVLAKAISQDQALVVKVLKLANSSVYTRGAPVDSIQKAVVRIGLDRIRQAVLNISVVERFSSVAFSERLETRQFWEHSIACGIIAAEIAHHIDAQHADSAYTSGLMHDVGRVVLAEQLKDTYVRVIDAAREANIPLELAETRMLGASHADVMERILPKWGFPKRLVKPVVLHHSSAGVIRSAAPEQMDDTAALSLANRLAHALLLGTSGNDAVYPIQELCESIRVGPEVVRRIEEVAQQQTDDVKFAMLSHSHAGGWPRRAEQLASTLTGPFRPLFVSAAPDLDAVRLFTSRLAPPGAEAPPTLGVIHVAREADAPRLLEQFKAAEAAKGAPPRPRHGITPPGRSHPYASESTRAWRHLTIPFTAQHFIASVNALFAGAAPAAKAA